MSRNSRHADVTDRAAGMGIRRSKEFRDLKRAIDSIPDVRIVKIRGLREAVLSGTYYVDAYAVAGKMLEELQTAGATRARDCS